MQDLYTKQLELEQQYSHDSILASIQQTKDAMEQGRLADTDIGQRIIMQAHSTVVEQLKEVSRVKRGRGAKYRALVARCDPELLAVASLRHVLGCCVQSNYCPFQDVVRSLGHMLETEVLIAAVDKVSPAYTAKTLRYLDNTKTSSINHRNRTFNVAAGAVRLSWDSWSSEERIGAGRLIMTALFETGLFRWEDYYETQKRVAPIQVIRPSEELAEHLTKTVNASKSVIKFPPMLVPPVKWLDPYSGGYLTSWYQHRAPMVKIKAPKSIRNWVLDRLAPGKAHALKEAMHKAQSVPYRINKTMLSLLERAVALGDGRLGLAATAPAPKPEFPLEDFDRATATEAELAEFKSWKVRMHAWHTNECTRVGRNAGTVSKLVELRRYQGYSALYFPTFVDSRGRLYFRGTLNPQGSDSTKGCLDFAEGKPLGEHGMFWLKVHIANCAGYDKHDPAIKVKWVDDNIGELLEFFNNPLEVTPPEEDTAFTLYRALLAYTEAMLLDAPSEYVCHVPIAMDATCSGLQHFSALLRDEVGAKYTNLTDSGKDQKEDIYKHVGSLADSKKFSETTDVLISEYWKDKEIQRSMAKRPVMTYVYGSTLKSTLEYLVTDLLNQGAQDIRDDQGNIVYTLNKLVVPVGKALRAAVEETVPAAARGMKFLQELVRASEAPIKWVTPVGMPVVNWSEDMIQRNIKIRSMGRTSAVFKMFTGDYNRTKATSSISPNFTHSNDSAHLCMTINAADCQILPIHDSFATHPCDVPMLHDVLRSTFIDMYQGDMLNELLASIVMREGYDLELPAKGNLNLEDIRNSRFTFC